MNVTELARRLRVPTQELRDKLPQMGFDFGQRAIKIDDRVAKKILKEWSRKNAEIEARKKVEADEATKREIAERDPEAAKIEVPDRIAVRDLATKMQLPVSKVMAELMKNGVLSSMNEMIDHETASIVASELGFEVSAADEEKNLNEQQTQASEQILTEKKDAQLEARAPVVVIMGHVDHGKTKLLDAIRETDVVAGESGGITQHIGAYQVEKNKQKISFIDTPGHEAFTTMRSRGARVADIAILVVAADDGIKAQTEEAIKIIKAAGLPMIVAINKIDKPEADVEKVKTELSSHGLQPEDWGGKTMIVPISALNGEGIDDLLEHILLVAEVEADNLKADANREAAGTIIEAHVDQGEGRVATVLVQTGTLKVGDHISINDNYYGKVRTMQDHHGQKMSEALPSTPAKLTGLKAAPSVGDVLVASATAPKGGKIKSYQLGQQAMTSRPVITNDDEEDDEKAESLTIILKSDVLGSLEAIVASLDKLEHPQVNLKILSQGLGNITEGDIDLASGSKAIVYGFHVQAPNNVVAQAREKKVEIKQYEVIYALIEDIHGRLEELLKPEIERVEVGTLKVLAIFRTNKDGMIVGGKVTKGVMSAGTKVDVVRDKAIITTGTIDVVQHNKVEVDRVETGEEGGLTYSGKPWIEVGDTLSIFKETTKVQKLKDGQNKSG